MKKDTHIAVVYGGTSTEREVSLRSGAAVHKALCDAGFTHVDLFDLKEDNLADLHAMRPDVAFLALHGKGGEDGSIQGALELLGIPYTGSGVAASAMCMDKIITKQMLTVEGIPTAPYTVIRRGDYPTATHAAEALLAEVTLPVVVKAPCQGSSVGVYMVKEASALPAAIDAAFAYGDRVLVEGFLRGVEITVPVIGNTAPRPLPIIEITSQNEFYDYEAKYTAGMCDHIIPARIPADVAAAVNRYALDTYRALDCRGFARIDFIVDEVLGPCVVEVNTIPGMTEMSLLPDSARAAGISFPDLVTRVCEMAVEA